MMIRHLFLREEGGRLVIGSGIFKEWLKGDTRLSFGPAPTPWGKTTVRIEPRSGRPRVRVDGNFSGERPGLDIALPGFRTIVNAAPNTSYEVRP
jgi:hypothetical protein